MKTNSKSAIFLALYCLVCATKGHSETEWNPLISEMQRTSIIKDVEEYRSKLKSQPLHVVISHGNSVLNKEGCQVGIMGYTNVLAYKPLSDEAFDARLFGSDGKEVPKTAYGRQFGKSPKPDRRLLDGSFKKDSDAMYGKSRELQFPTGDGSDHYWDFVVMKAFKIKKTGMYRLQIEVRLFVEVTNGVFQPLVLPPAETQVQISEKELKGGELGRPTKP